MTRMSYVEMEAAVRRAQTNPQDPTTRPRLTEQEKDELVDEIMLGCEDAIGENPDLGEDNIVYELAASMTTGLHPADAKDVQQRVGIYL